MSVYASVQFFDLCRCSVNEIAAYLDLHEWQVRQILARPAPKKRKRAKGWVVLWRAKDYRREVAKGQ
jgi:hypothetical protein